MDLGKTRSISFARPTAGQLFGVKLMSRSKLFCNVCGNEGAHVRRITRSYGKNDNLLVIENVPIVNCPHCGESYMTAETMHEIERIKMHRQDFAEERKVPVAKFA